MKKYIYICLCILLCGCVQNVPDNGIDKPTIPEGLNVPTIDWGKTKNDVLQLMDDYELIYLDDNTLVFDGLGIEKIISYSFEDNKLNASIVFVDSSKITLTELNKLFISYKKTNDEYGGYLSSDDATYANITNSGNYYCIGWAVCDAPNNTGNDGNNEDNEKPIGTANNKICYTNGSITEATAPNNTEAFGAKIISNKYDSKNKCWVITFDEDVTTIGNYAFENCSNLTSVTIPDSVTTIGKNAFKDCNKLTNMIIPNSVVSIGECAFYNCSSLTDITIGSGVTLIEHEVFFHCSNLTSVTIPDSVTSIKYGAFSGCTNLAKFDGKYAVDGGRCLIVNNKLIAFAPAGITEYSIPSNVIEIGTCVFEDCSSLTSVTIPSGVTTIGNYAFDGCSRLKNVYCEAIIPPNGGYYMFRDNAYGREIYVYEESFESYKSAPRWEDYASSFVGYGSITDPQTTTIYYTTSDGNIINPVLPIKSNSYNNGMGEIIVYGELTHMPNGAFTDCITLTSITIPDSVEIINYLAFSGCSSLTSVTIPNGVTTIGSYAFSGCISLSCITIPDSVTKIGECAFKSCNLTSVFITDLSIWCNIDFENNPLCCGAKLYIDNTEVTELIIPSDISEIKQKAFYGYCYLTSVTMGDSVTTIGAQAFGECNGLTSVIIGNSVTAIGERAFDKCKSLSNITIGNKVNTIGKEAFANCDSLTHITIPEGVTNIEESAFQSCDGLTSVTIPDSVTTIGLYAFAFCDSLTSVTIGNGVKNLGAAFFECNELSKVYCKAVIPPSLGKNAFLTYNKDFEYEYIGCYIYVPKESVEVYKSAENWSNYANYIVGYDFGE